MLMVRRNGTERVFTLTDASTVQADTSAELAAELEEAAAVCGEILGPARVELP